MAIIQHITQDKVTKSLLWTRYTCRYQTVKKLEFIIEEPIFVNLITTPVARGGRLIII